MKTNSVSSFLARLTVYKDISNLDQMFPYKGHTKSHFKVKPPKAICPLIGGCLLRSSVLFLN